LGAAQRTTLSADAWDSNTGTELLKVPGIEWASQVQLSRFASGGPGQVRETHEKLDKPAKGSLQLRLPPVSITALRIAQVVEAR